MGKLKIRYSGKELQISMVSQKSILRKRSLNGAPCPFENMFEHWLSQALSLGVLLTWLMGGKGDFTVGKQIFMTMSELRLGRGPSLLRYDLYRQITLRTNGVPYKVKKLQIVF